MIGRLSLNNMSARKAQKLSASGIIEGIVWQGQTREMNGSANLFFIQNFEWFEILKKVCDLVNPIKISFLEPALNQFL